ncbi:type II toxin-antitoxin system RelE/ParE family toxin [Flavobacterium tegetincola]|uniref:type II toxin-antitoxin system RelE/ParE family toxin n=1 Tax=Flavobacterium tegetincola TaxID=150172 RepID=UPI0003F53A3F|nr:type II toxin-antitoxin system RelE/ParE family toxin [Flavobacterium tegetincola]
MVRINWTKLAVSDLLNIYEYISKDSKRYAEMQVVRIKVSTKVLVLFPLSGKVVAEIDQKEIRELIEGKYRIIYKLVSPTQIDILTVHHSARDLSMRKL